jgi:hypothetical protein
VSTIDQLVKQCLRLKGDREANPDRYAYGPSLCLRCHGPIKAEGQEALHAVATERGIYFRCKLPCVLPHHNARCGGTVGCVRLDLDVQDDTA